MNEQIIYYSLLFLLSLAGISVFMKMREIVKNQKPRIKRSPYQTIQKYVKSRVDEESINELFQKSGLRINAVQYQFVRYTFFIFILFTYLLLSSFEIGFHFSAAPVVTMIFLFFITSPTSYLFRWRTPFRYVLDLLTQNFRYKKTLETYRAISQLKNLAIAKQEDPPGSDLILEQIRKFTKTTRPIFNRMIALWQMDRKDEACAYLANALDTKEAVEFANALRKLDDMNPIELKNHLIMFQEMIQEERVTLKTKQNEVKSYLIYFVVTTTAMLILLNFVIVVFFIESLNSLKFL